MRQLLDQWSHPAFASVEGFSELLDATRRVEGGVGTADWTRDPSTRGAAAFRPAGLNQVPAGSPHVPVDAPHIRQGPVPLRGVPRTQVGGAHSKRPGAVNDARAISARAKERRIAWTPRRYAKS